MNNEWIPNYCEIIDFPISEENPETAHEEISGKVAQIIDFQSKWLERQPPTTISDWEIQDFLSHYPDQDELKVYEAFWYDICESVAEILLDRKFKPKDVLGRYKAIANAFEHFVQRENNENEKLDISLDDIFHVIASELSPEHSLYIHSKIDIDNLYNDHILFLDIKSYEQLVHAVRMYAMRGLAELRREAIIAANKWSWSGVWVYVDVDNL